MSSGCRGVWPRPCWMQEFVDYRNERGKMLLSRRNQLLLEFSFWNEPVARPGPNIYELRSYQLRVNPPCLHACMALTPGLLSVAVPSSP